jgi:DNA mismatch repair ATPase MutS
MMQAGMFVCAEYFSASTCHGLFTHFKREEDAALRSGKLDEELARMNGIAGHLKPGSMVLFNESFAATNEREGSSISRDIIRALTEAGVRVLFVTHLYDLAHSLFDRGPPDALFLQAERQADGTRTFRLQPGEPTRTSYGEDLYTRVFGPPARDAAPERQAPEEARHGSI